MAHRFEEVLEYADELAMACGQRHVTRSMFEDWIFEDFFPRARPESVGDGTSRLIWLLPDGTRETIAQIIELKSRGIRRHAQVRICLWLYGQPVDHDRLRVSLVYEHCRLTRQFERYLSIFSDETFEQMSDRKRQRFKARIMKLKASRLVIGNRDIVLEGMANFLSALGTADTTKKSVSYLIRDVVHRSLKALLPNDDIDEGILEKLSFDVGGIFDEMLIARGKSELMESISIDDLNIARDRLLAFIGALDFVANSEAMGALGVQIDTAAYAQAARLLRVEYTIPAFMLFAIEADRSGKRFKKVA